MPGLGLTNANSNRGGASRSFLFFRPWLSIPYGEVSTGVTRQHDPCLEDFTSWFGRVFRPRKSN